MDDDIPAVRNLRIEVVMIPWLVLTTLLVVLLIFSGSLDSARRPVRRLDLAILGRAPAVVPLRGRGRLDAALRGRG